MRRVNRYDRAKVAQYTFYVPCVMAERGTHPLNITMDQCGLVISIHCPCQTESKEAIHASKILHHDAKVCTDALQAAQKIIALKTDANYNNGIGLDAVLYTLHCACSGHRVEKMKYSRDLPAPPDFSGRVAHQASRLAGFRLRVEARPSSGVVPAAVSFRIGYENVAKFREQQDGSMRWEVDDEVICKSAPAIEYQTVHLDDAFHCKICKREFAYSKNRKVSGQRTITAHNKSKRHRQAVAAGVHRAMAMFKPRVVQQKAKKEAA
jgi:hypothetical protein